MIRSSLQLVERNLQAITDALASFAQQHRDTPMVGRSNLQQATSMTFVYKVAVWPVGLDRRRERLQQMKSRVLMGEFGGQGHQETLRPSSFRETA